MVSNDLRIVLNRNGAVYTGPASMRKISTCPLAAPRLRFESLHEVVAIRTLLTHLLCADSDSREAHCC